jgi:dephospho-CoA kinase
MKKIVLTGGIASGKSFATHFFSGQHIPVLDLDDINKEILLTNQDNLRQIFGVNIIENNQINTNKIKQIVFNDAEKLSQLEALLHPQILAKMQQVLTTLKAKIVIIVVPLLYEKQLFNYFDAAIVISTTKENQLKRLIKRDKIAKSLAQEIINTQATDKERLKTANYLPTTIIENNSTLENFTNQLQQIKL